MKSIEQLFAESLDPNRITYEGRDLVRMDRFPLHGARRLKVVFEATDSDWSQAVSLKSERPMEIEGYVGNEFALWTETAPPEVIVTCDPRENCILIYNAWDPGTGSPFAWVGCAAMIVEEIPEGRRYRCNDGYPDDDFDDLIFRIERHPA